MDWYQTTAICGTVFAGVGMLVWLVNRLDSDVKQNTKDVQKQGERSDKQGDRIDKLIHAFMDFQRDTDKLIYECKKDMMEMDKILNAKKK